MNHRIYGSYRFPSVWRYIRNGKDLEWMFRCRLEILCYHTVTEYFNNIKPRCAKADKTVTLRWIKKYRLTSLAISKWHTHQRFQSCFLTSIARQRDKIKILTAFKSTLYIQFANYFRDQWISQYWSSMKFCVYDS